MDSGPTDPNEARDQERARGKDRPNLSPDDQWGESQNPVRETDNAVTGVSDGGSGGG